MAEVDAKLQAARAARDKAKPTAALLREANLRAEKASKAAVAAEEARKCQAAPQAAHSKLQEARQAEAAARAQQLEAQARVANEAPPRAVGNDVDVFRVQCAQLAGRVGVSLEDLGLAAGLAGLAANLGQQVAEEAAAAPGVEPVEANGGGQVARGR